jgi:shikimate kinase
LGKLVFLCGLMGSGKTTVGPVLASRLALPFCDLDRAIEQDAGATVRELFTREGETGFREREARALLRVCAAGAQVVALGGGALGRADNRELVRRSGRLVWLDAPTPILVARIGDPSSRPLLGDDPASALDRLRAARADQYGEAGLRLDTSRLDAQAAAEQIVTWLLHS